MLLARHSLLATMRCVLIRIFNSLTLCSPRFSLLLEFLAQNESQELVDHKWSRLEAMSEMLSSMSKEYREIAQQLQVGVCNFIG